MKFLHDKHSYGTKKLHSEGLAQFQVRFIVLGRKALAVISYIYNTTNHDLIYFLIDVLKRCILLFIHAQTILLKQGPALYAYNDAQFTKEDWRGIRMLCDSIQVKDPMKVGRFGLGFKSVFHITGKSQLRPGKL